MSKDSHSVHLSIPFPGLTTIWMSLWLYSERLSQETENKISKVNAIIVVLFDLFLKTF